MKKLWASFFVVLALCVASAWAGETTRSGVLIDTLCGETSAHNAEKVEDHTVACSLMKNCQASGFGLVVDATFFKFDGRGDDLALALLEKTSQRRKLRIAVTGLFDTQGDTVLVKSLEPVKADVDSQLHTPRR